MLVRSVTALLLSFICTHVFAALGEPATQFLSAAAASSHSEKTATSIYVIRETTLEGGVVIREYVAANGKVFATSWEGAYLPDLRQLLGKYFDLYTDAATNRPHAGHSRLAWRGTDFAVTAGGHMGAFEGRAWLPNRLPSGFDLQAFTNGTPTGTSENAQ